MPHPTLPVLSARAHKPLISFVGKRIWPSCTHTVLSASSSPYSLASSTRASSPPSRSTARVSQGVLRHPTAHTEYRQGHRESLLPRLLGGSRALLATKAPRTATIRNRRHSGMYNISPFTPKDIDNISRAVVLHYTDVWFPTFVRLTIVDRVHTCSRESVLFRVRQQVFLHFSLLHHPPFPPRFRILFIRRRHNPNLYLSWLVISCVNRRHGLDRNL